MSVDGASCNCQITMSVFFRFQDAWPSGIQCQPCHMMFTDQSEINAHYDTAHAQTTSKVKREAPGARFACEICGRKSTTKQTLKHHLAAVHGVGDVKTFQCSVCSRVFNDKSNLARHIKTKHQ